MKKILIIYGIIVMPLGIICGLLAPGLSIIAYCIVYFGIVDLLIANIIMLIIYIYNKKNIIGSLLYIIITIIYLLFSYRLHNLIHNYNETKKGLNKYYHHYKIVGLSKQLLVYEDNHNYCDYTFDVTLNDNSNIVFQAGYCNLGNWMSHYATTDNYISYYLKYYYNLYKQTNKVTFKMETNTNIVKELAKITYNTNNCEEVYYFLKYILKNNKYKSYKIILYNEDTNENHYISSWNDNYEQEFSRYLHVRE